ncbi:MAG: hypothetical protein A3F16_05695 [Deltaproteobacteria bacterium RIFCSPHIGHO2_12_FULL_43_9]|nr:MAG: hypothetical protein A3F16_05695 [Deltaproteobacteria bacterium RIFCSPHIGHO2_12_FULL_43_9]
MKKISRNYYQQILEELYKAGVEFIIGGGVAAALHGVERFTVDIDLSLHMTKSNIKKFIEVMKQTGLRPRVPVNPEVLLDPGERARIVEEKNAVVFTFIDPDDLFMHVDIFLTENLSYGRLLNDTETLKIGDYSFKVLTKGKLVELKKSINPLRDKDYGDIKKLTELINAEKNKK